MGNEKIEMLEGQIKTIGNDERFAFITPDDYSKDIIFKPLHPEDKKALGELTVGTRVLFEKVMTNQGPKIKVMKIGDKEIMGEYHDRTKIQGIESTVAASIETESRREIKEREVLKGEIKSLFDRKEDSWGRAPLKGCIYFDDGRHDQYFTVAAYKGTDELEVGTKVVAEIKYTSKGPEIVSVKIDDAEKKNKN
jgi:cold shock CspA family protein